MGNFFVYALIRFRASRHPVADYRGARTHTSTYLEVGVAVVEAVFLLAFSIPLWAARVDRVPPESEAVVVQVTGEQFAWNVHYPGPDRVFGRTDIKLLDLQSNPLGLDRNDPAAKDDITTLNQLYLPVNKPSDHQAQEQGRHPQLRRTGISRQAGRRPGLHDTDLVRPRRHDGRDAGPDRQPRVSVTRSPAHSCAAWATTGCAPS